MLTLWCLLIISLSGVCCEKVESNFEIADQEEKIRIARNILTEFMNVGSNLVNGLINVGSQGINAGTRLMNGTETMLESVANSARIPLSFSNMFLSPESLLKLFLPDLDQYLEKSRFLRLLFQKVGLPVFEIVIKHFISGSSDNIFGEILPLVAKPFVEVFLETSCNYKCNDSFSVIILPNLTELIVEVLMKKDDNWLPKFETLLLDSLSEYFHAKNSDKTLSKNEDALPVLLPGLLSSVGKLFLDGIRPIEPLAQPNETESTTPAIADNSSIESDNFNKTDEISNNRRSDNPLFSSPINTKSVMDNLFSS